LTRLAFGGPPFPSPQCLPAGRQRKREEVRGPSKKYIKIIFVG